MAFQKPFKEVTGDIFCRHYQLNPKRWSGKDVMVYVEYRSIPNDMGFCKYRVESFFSVDTLDERLYLSVGELIFKKEELDRLDHLVDEYVKKMLRESTAMLIIQDYIKDYCNYSSKDGDRPAFINPTNSTYHE